jgi:hypothetical protein
VVTVSCVISQSVKDRVEDLARVGIDVRGWARQQDTARVSAYVDLMGRISGAVGTVAVLLLLTGCGQSKPAVSTVTTSTPTPRPTTYYGETATAIASQVEGCSDIKAGDVGKGGPGMASTATCMLNGRTVTINSWTTADARDGVNAVLKANKAEAYFAQGEGWTVTATDDPGLQLQLANDAAALIANSFAGKATPAPDLPGQKASAEAAVAALDGTVVHVQP